MRSRRRFSYWLVTDLDGTFLGGPEQSQKRLTDLFTDSNRNIGLIYCSGRSFANILPLLQSGRLPPPSAMIGDVGTSLWDTSGHPLSKQFDQLVAQRWGDARLRVLQKTHSFKDLELQTGTGPYRCSFVYSRRRSAELAAESIRHLALDTLISGGCYFDVLPKGINKGFAVAYLLELWGIDPKSVLVAGDTLNDLSMLSLSRHVSGLHALAVGNADADLRREFIAHPRAVYAQGHGAAGILERLQQLSWVG